MKIAVMGANGFTGSNVVRACIARGYHVSGIVRNDEAAEEVKKAGGKATVVSRYDIENLVNAIQGIDVLVHTIAIGRGRQDEMQAVNVGIVEKVLVAAKQAGVKKIIYMSGLGTAELGEMDEPAMVYYHTKRDAEKRIMESGIPFTILRPSFIVGRGSYFVRQILTDMANGRIIVPSSPDARLQPISIDDAVDAILEAAGSPATDGKTFDVVGPDTITIETMVMKVFKAVSNLGVKISPPVIETCPTATADPVWDENYDFLQHDIRGDPAPLRAILLKHEFRPVDGAIRDAIDEILKPSEPVPEKGAVMLLSGGLDSINTLYWARKNGYDVHPVSIRYPNRPLRELLAVEKIASRIGIHVTEVDVPYLYEVLELKLQGYRVPSIFGASDYYVPYRNLLFNAIATYFADIHGARFIISGHISSDPLPDASEGFFKQLETLVENLKVGTKAVAPKFLVPLKGKTKADVVRMAIELGVPLEWTWSCAFDGDAPCGKCKPCRERASAFKDAGQTDPVLGFRPASWKDTAREN